MNTNQQIQKVYEELREMRVIENQCDFSRLCGRKPMWFSCIKARELPLTSDAALTLAYRLRRIAKNSLCENTHYRLIRISEALLDIAYTNVANRLDNTDALL